METLQVVKNQEVLGKDFKIYGSFENPLFLAKDVAEWIEYDVSSINKMLNTVDEDEKVRNIIPTLGGKQESWFLTENGLYEVLMLSRKPIAKQFKKEVKKILHDLRVGNAILTPKTFSEALYLAAKQQEQIEQQEKLLLEQKPKVEFYDDVTGSSDTVDMKEVAKILNCGLGRNKLFELLRNKKILDSKNQPYQTYVDNGCFRIVESKFESQGDIKINLKTVVFQKGVDLIRKIVNE